MESPSRRGAGLECARDIVVSTLGFILAISSQGFNSKGISYTRNKARQHRLLSDRKGKPVVLAPRKYLLNSTRTSSYDPTHPSRQSGNAMCRCTIALIVCASCLSYFSILKFLIDLFSRWGSARRFALSPERTRAPPASRNQAPDAPALPVACDVAHWHLESHHPASKVSSILRY